MGPVETLLLTHMERTEANRLGHVVIEFATLSLLIDAKIVTLEEAAARIELIQKVLPSEYQAADVGERVALVTGWLRSLVKQPRGQWKPQVIEGGLSRVEDSDSNHTN